MLSIIQVYIPKVSRYAGIENTFSHLNGFSDYTAVAAFAVIFVYSFFFSLTCTDERTELHTQCIPEGCLPFVIVALLLVQ